MHEKRHDYSKGSFTVEISMIFTLIVLAILALLFTFLYMQQKAYLVSAASFAAQQGAELWQDSRRSMENGAIATGTGKDPVSYRVLDNLLLSRKTFEGYLKLQTTAEGESGYVLIMDTGKGLPGKKIGFIGEALGRKIENAVLKPESTKVRLTYSNNGIRGRLTAEVIQEIKIPLGGIKEFFDGKDTLSLRGSSTASIAEPAEYIRNVDLAVELSKRFGESLDFKGILENIKAKGQK